MRLDDLPESGNIEDRRGEGGFAGGGGFGLPIGGGGLGIGTIVVLGIIGWALGIDPSLLIGGAEVLSGPNQTQMQGPPTARRTSKPQDDMGRFVNRVLGSTEERWKEVFAKDGKTYRAPVLVLYRGRTDARCGGAAQSAMGPFYCPADQKVYLDTSFFDQIATRFRGCDIGSKSCQFSQAYVIAHEVGHHVQNLLGILPKAQQAQRVANSKALRTAAAIGDDTLQRRSQGYAVPDSFTHGSSEQRQRWFNTGFRSGSVQSCNTFASAQL
jgi:predicted metalloprotease